MAQKFDKAIRDLNRMVNEEVGKVVGDYAKTGNPKLALAHSTVKHLKEAIEILSNHERNVSV